MIAERALAAEEQLAQLRPDRRRAARLERARPRRSAAPPRGRGRGPRCCRTCVENWPAARVATQPPTVESVDRLRVVAGRVAARVERRLVDAAHHAGLRRARRATSRSARGGGSSRARSTTSEPAGGVAPPTTPEPAPKGTTATPWLLRDAQRGRDLGRARAAGRRTPAPRRGGPAGRGGARGSSSRSGARRASPRRRPRGPRRARARERVADVRSCEAPAGSRPGGGSASISARGRASASQPSRARRERGDRLDARRAPGARRRGGGACRRSSTSSSVSAISSSSACATSAREHVGLAERLGGAGSASARARSAPRLGAVEADEPLARRPGRARGRRSRQPRSSSVAQLVGRAARRRAAARRRCGTAPPCAEPLADEVDDALRHAPVGGQLAARDRDEAVAAAAVMISSLREISDGLLPLLVEQRPEAGPGADDVGARRAARRRRCGSPPRAGSRRRRR